MSTIAASTPRKSGGAGSQAVRNVRCEPATYRTEIAVAYRGGRQDAPLLRGCLVDRLWARVRSPRRSSFQRRAPTATTLRLSICFVVVMRVRGVRVVVHKRRGHMRCAAVEQAAPSTNVRSTPLVTSVSEYAAATSDPQHRN